MVLRIASMFSWLWGSKMSVISQFRTHLVIAYTGWKSICNCNWFYSCFTGLVGFDSSNKKLDGISSQGWRWGTRYAEVTLALLFLPWRLRNLTSHCHYLCSKTWIGFFQNKLLMYKSLQFNTIFFPAQASWILFSATDLTYKLAKLGKSREYLTRYRWYSRKQYPEIWVTWVLFSPLPAALAQVWIKTF